MRRPTNLWWRIVISIVCFIMISVSLSSCDFLLPKGRCIYGYDEMPLCQDDITESDCDDLDGSWSEGGKCD